ncbi:MAG: hypothetical protein HC905_07795 [Bacteroidales bacterium]|nr:hypothetical protein [Bacteroidales bacterium]
MANENLSYWEFFETLSIIREKAQTKILLPKFLILTMGIFGSLFEKISKRPAMLNYTNARLLCLKLYYSGNKAVKELEMPQTPVSDSIAAAICWFENNNIISKQQI